MDEVIGKLDPKDYWEWRTSIAEMQLAKAEYEREALRLGHMEKDLELGRLRIALFKNSLELNRAEAEKTKRAYEEFKKLLEDKLGQPLNGCVIDDVSYEVKKIKE